MASGHFARQWLECFKFSVYIATPIAATIYLGTGTYPYLEKIIQNRAYVTYPPEGETPTQEQVDKASRDLRRRLAAVAAHAKASDEK